MGRFATDVQGRLREHLADRRPDYEWSTEYDLAGTPVDVGGYRRESPAADRSRGTAAVDDHPPETLALVELEWRRADPANNTAKLFRYLTDGTIEADRVVVCQCFTAYYDLVSGGVSSKRENATFVGRVAADRFERVTYRPIDLAIDPPKRGGDRPDGWRSRVAEAAAVVADSLPGDGDPAGTGRSR